ncbi:12579_t:CDS:2 [Ambispora leptoticha]|uniref:ATP phosphoribosyltransferase n=1 Tax=Ambispora leptoticha TaxID=144679 RepID=A0A9N9IA74_9GLOM|nr:12579_t:CDS:2 [Ambispora leptoticha]
MDLSLLPGRLLFAIPKKGRLHEKCISLLQGANIAFHRHNRLDIALVQNLPIALIFLPAADIAKFVGEGNVDLGITGQDMVEEAEVSDKVVELLELGFGKCKLQVQVPENGTISSVEELSGKRIVTSFKSLAEKYFRELDAKVLKPEEIARGEKTRIRYVTGSVEASCALGLADGIVDLVESGETMKAAGLHAISTILNTQAVLIRNKNPSNYDLVTKITSRIRGVIAAEKYVLLNYNIERTKLKNATKITPGRQAPTISSLEDPDWLAVQAMVEKSTIAEIMDQIEAIGAKDILVFTISNCRVMVDV